MVTTKKAMSILKHRFDPPRPRIKRKRAQKLSRRAVALTHETRYLLSDAAATSLSTTPSFTVLNLMQQGDTAGTRDGNKIYLQSVDLRVQLIVADTTNLVRMLLVYDRQSNASNPSAVGIANILDVPAAASQALGPQLIPTKRRYNILLDRIFTLDLVDKYTWMIHKHIKINKYTEYNGNAGTVADIITGGLYLIFISDSTAVSHPTMQFTAKLFFKDI